MEMLVSCVCIISPDFSFTISSSLSLSLSLLGMHHGAVLLAVLLAIHLFGLLACTGWFVYKKMGFRRLTSLGPAYYRQSSSQSTESDGNVLIADLELTAGE